MINCYKRFSTNIPAIVFPILKPTPKQTISPGPAVAATPSISFKITLAFFYSFMNDEINIFNM